MMDDIYAANGGEDIAITLTEDGVTYLPFPEESQELIEFSETLILSMVSGYGEGEKWIWFIDGLDIDGNEWQHDEEADLFRNYNSALKNALEYIKNHHNATEWKRGIKTINKLMTDSSLDPRTNRIDKTS